LYDIVVVGSGPAGLSAAVYAKRGGLAVAVVEKEYLGTGQIAESSQVDNYLGLPGINGYDLGEKFLEHAKRLEIPFVEACVTGFSRESSVSEGTDGCWVLHTEEEQEIRARSVIYAAGAIPRTLEAASGEELPRAGISYCAVCDGAFYQGKDVAVIGGGDTALDDAMYLSDICRKVYLVHRRGEFRGSAATVEKLRRRDNVEFVLEAKVAHIRGTDKVDALELDSGRVLEVNGIFVAIGMVPQTGMLQGIVALDAAGYVLAGESGKTSAPFFYVAGDVRQKELRQVVTAVADGANAAFALGRELQK
jgi:thioredoxin reductase (NADPH)